MPRHSGLNMRKKSRANGLSRRRDVAQLKSRANGLSRNWDVAQMKYRAVEMSRNWSVAQLGCRADGMTHNWNIAQLERRATGRSRNWNVAQIKCRSNGCRARKKSRKWHFPHHSCRYSTDLWWTIPYFRRNSSRRLFTNSRPLSVRKILIFLSLWVSTIDLNSQNLSKTRSLVGNR